MLAGLKLGFNLHQRLRFSLLEAGVEDAAEAEEARVEAKEERWL